MVRVPEVRLLGLVAAVLLLAGCSSSSSGSTPSAAPPPPASTPGPPASTGPCPHGDYLVTELEGRGEASDVGKGTGGNIAATFSSGTFTLSSDGSVPVKIHVGPGSAEMRFDGKIVGDYSGPASALRLTTTSAEGDVSVHAFGLSRSRSLSALSNQLIGQGATAQLTCDDSAGTAVVVLPNASLTLTRTGG